MPLYNYRNLTPNEINLARSVFDASLPYNDVYLADGYYPANNGTAVTILTYNPIQTAPLIIRKDFSIFFGMDVYRNGVDNVAFAQDTFIHELTHVWQGYNEKRVHNYMIRSLIAQGWAFATHLDRNSAYNYDPNNYLRWADYNVEQQGNIVLDWFSRWNGNALRGNGSTSDPRFVYIEKVIRAGNPNAPDVPVIAPTSAAPVHPRGFSQPVQDNQRLLIKKGFRIRDDGLFGGETIGAIKKFQRNHNLNVTGKFDAPTIKLLKRP